MKPLITCLSFIAASLILAANGTTPLSADLVLTSVGGTVTESFDSFDGSGFSSTPTAGQLDSNTYRATGFSDGNGVFGGTHTTGDFARGQSTGGVTTGGAYAFDVGGGDIAVGVQQGGDDFTPGDFTIRLLNDTGQSINGIIVDASGYFFNDQGRSSLWEFALSLDDINYSPPFFSITSDEAADNPAMWDLQPIFGFVPFPVEVADGAQIYFRITGDDFGGAGSRDEFALSQISFTATSAVPEPTSAVVLIGLLGVALMSRKRED